MAKVVEFCFSISPSNEHLGLISFRMYWLDLLAVQGTLKSLLQHHSSKASILRCSDFFIIQLSHPYMTTGETVALTRWTFVGKAMSLLFNMLSRLIITFLPGSKRLLISWLQSLSAMILEPRKIKSATVSTLSPTICHDLRFLNVEFEANFFTLHFHFHQEAFEFLFTFCHKGIVICISEVIDISPSNLDSSLCFFQPSVSHDEIGRAH